MKRRAENGNITDDEISRLKARVALLEANERNLRAMLADAGDGMIATDAAGVIRRMNPAAERLTGWRVADAVGRPVAEIYRTLDPVASPDRVYPGSGCKAEPSQADRLLLIAKDGGERVVTESITRLFDEKGDVAEIVRLFREPADECPGDMDRRFIKAHLDLSRYAGDHTLDELLTRALDEVGAFVESTIGFYTFVEPDEKRLCLQQWSTRTLKDFRRAEGKGLHYHVDKAGIWAECVHTKAPVIHNDYASIPHKKGMPAGHARVVRELVVPVLREGKVVAILGVGNKPTDYTARDVEIVSYFADVTWEIVRQKRAEASLREAALREKEAVRAANVGLWDWDLVTNTVHYSDEWKRQIGYEPDEIGDGFSEWEKRVHPDDLGPTIGKIEAAMAEGLRSYQVEFRFRHKDGSWRWIMAHASIIRQSQGDAAGKPVRTLGAHVDITERKKAEAALGESEALFRSIFEHHAAVKLIIDPETGRIIDANRAAEIFYGWTKAELRTMGVHDLNTLPPDAVGRKMAQARAERRAYFEFQHRLADGSVRDVEVYSSKIEVEGKELLHSIVHDVTEKHRSQRDYRNLFERMQNGFALHEIILDGEGKPVDYRFLAVNPAFERMTGLRDADIRGKTVLEILPGTESHWIETYGRVALTGEPVSFENYSKAIDKSFEVTAFRPESGRFACVISDITGRKRAEARLQAALEQQEAIFESSMVGIVVMHGRRITRVNRRMGEMLGYTPEEVVGLSPEPFHLSRENFVKFGEKYHARLAERAVVQVEYPLRHRDGRTVWSLFSGRAIAPPDIDLGVVWVIDDITGRKVAEEQREFLISAIEQSGEIIMITDAAGRIQYVNPAFERVTGYTCEEALGKNPRILKSSEHDPAFYREMWNTLLRGETWAGRMVDRKKDGTLFTEEAVISPVRDASGRTTGYVAAKRDITEQLRLEAEKDDLEKQFRQAQKLESIGRLAGGVAHDLNNMLSPILGFAEIVLDELHRESDLRESVEEIIKAGKRARDLVRQLLAFSRKQTLAFRTLDLNDMLRNFEKLLRRTIREDVAIDLVLAEGLPTVRGDIGQLEQVIMNLAVNAQDAMPGGGRLRIETARVQVEAEETESLPDLVPGEYVSLIVSDTGEGMDAETRERLFEPFFTTKEQGKGTGLGLATVYGIVKQHGGNIRVRSEPGEGTTFTVHLPVFGKSGWPGETSAAPKIEVGARGTETVLLVEDNEQVRGFVLAILKREGYTVLVAEGGKSALALLEHHDGPLHLLLTDVVMPEMNGRELFARVSRVHPKVRVIYMSGYTDDVIAERGVVEAGVHFIQKPFSVKVLAAKIREALA